MTEKQVRAALDFLVEEYAFKYVYQLFENCPFGNWCTETYSYYNDNGCFTITNICVRGDVGYVHLKNIELLKTFMYSDASERVKYLININSIEEEIWKKHEKASLFKRFFWGDKKYLSIVAEIIRSQIKKNGAFFGIKIGEAQTAV